MGCASAKSKNPTKNTTIRRAPRPYDPSVPLTLTVEDLMLQSRTISTTQGTLVRDLYAQVKTQFGSEREFSLYFVGKELWKNEEKTLGESGVTEDSLIDLVYKPK